MKKCTNYFQSKGMDVWSRRTANVPNSQMGSKCQSTDFVCPQSQRNFALALNRFPACTHDHAQRDDELKPWFVAGQRNSKCKKLEEAVRGKRGKNLEDLRHLDQCVQTSRWDHAILFIKTSLFLIWLVVCCAEFSSVENLFSLVTLVYCRKAVFLR